MPSQQLVEKIGFAHEVGFLNPFFATGFPGQKTLLSAQVYWKRLRLIPYARGLHFIFDKMRKAWQSQASGFVRRKSPFRGFFDGITGGQLLPSRFVYSIMIIFPALSVVYSIFGRRRQYPLESLSAVHSM